MGSGQKSFVSKETLTSLMDATVDEFIDMLKSMSVYPTPQEAERMLVPELRNRIDIRNNTADKTDQWKKPSTLLPVHIARIMCVIDEVRRIKFMSKSRHRNNDLLALYQDSGPNVGLYTYDEEIITARIREYSSTLRLDAVKEVLGILREIAPEAEKCADRDLIPVNNGIFNYATKQLQPFTPDLVFLSKSWVDYNPNAQNVFITMPDGEVWDCDSEIAILSSDAEQERLHWQMMSAVLRPNVSWNKSILMYSTTGNNGKGTLVEILRNLIGFDAYASIPLAEFGAPFALSPLLHAQAILVDENDVGTYVDKCSQFKAIVTGDDIDINQKYRPVIKTVFKGLVVECVNEYPQVKDKSDSIMRRLLINPCEANFEGIERKYIKDDYLQRQDVLEYYLKRALEGNFYAFDEPKICKAALGDYQIANDPVAEFWDDISRRLVWEAQPLSWLYELYKAWFDVNHPKGKTFIPAKVFKERVVLIATKSEAWSYKSGQVRVTSKQGNLMDGYEPLIAEYDVKKYMNPNYTGVDVQKRCMFVRPENVYGCLFKEEPPVLPDEN